MRHPILCWRLADDLVLGHLVGTDCSIGRPDEQAVVAALLAEAERLHAPPVDEARLLRVVVPVRPSESFGPRFVGPDPVRLPVDAVLVRVGAAWECHLPRLDHRFGLSGPDDVETLVAEETITWSHGESPQEIHSHLLAPAPWLLTPYVRPRAPLRPPPAERPVPPTLAAVAEREPPERRRGGKPEPGPWTRGDLVDRVSHRLVRGRSVVLVGDPGVGKSTILRAAIAQAQVEASFWRTTVHRIVGGARYLGEWQEKADALAEALVEVNGVVWVEDLLELFTYGGDSASESIAAYWRRPLLEGEFGLVGELTPRALDVVRARLPDVAALFEVVEVPEMGAVAAREVVDRYCAALGPTVTFTPEARRRAFRLLDRFVRYERFPGKAIRFLRLVADTARREGQDALDDADVLAAFVRRTKLPERLVDDRVALRPDDVKAALGEKIVAQPAALDAAARAIVAWKAGVNDPDRPIATLLFAGPTGVGKTATARALAEWCYGDGRSALVRVDMSELQHPGQVERVIGTRRAPGALVRQVRERPFAVVLLDEIEKAHPMFFDLLLGVLDEGRLVDALGRETDFRNAILVLTTNLGTKRGASLGFGAAAGDVDLGAIRGFFRPEMINRIDEIVPFAALDRDAARRIARAELEALGSRPGLRARRIALRFSDAVVEEIVRVGFDPAYGARPLQRAIEQRVVAALSACLVDDQRLADATLHVDVEAGAVTVRS